MMIAMAQTSIDSLDSAALSTVFSHMKPSDLAASASVSRDWASLASDDRLWAAAYRSLDSKAFQANAAHQLANLRTGGAALRPFTRMFASHDPPRTTHAVCMMPFQLPLVSATRSSIIAGPNSWLAACVSVSHVHLQFQGAGSSCASGGLWPASAAPITFGLRRKVWDPIPPTLCLCMRALWLLEQQHIASTHPLPFLWRRRDEDVLCRTRQDRGARRQA